eukprot:10141305-Alexandrium_andersonii.AAC.1
MARPGKLRSGISILRRSQSSDVRNTEFAVARTLGRGSIKPKMSGEGRRAAPAISEHCGGP